MFEARFSKPLSALKPVVLSITYFAYEKTLLVKHVATKDCARRINVFVSGPERALMFSGWISHSRVDLFTAYEQLADELMPDTTRCSNYEPGLLW